MDDNSFNNDHYNNTPSLGEFGGSKYQKLIENKSLQLYMMRSFKATQALCDTRNLKYITQTNHRAIETYCKLFSIPYKTYNFSQLFIRLLNYKR